MADIAATLAKYPVIVRQAVVWGDMDSYQHVNNVVYFRYFENARLEYFRRLDWFAFERETGIGPILAATQARFRRPLTYPDTISIAARVIGLDSSAAGALDASHANDSRGAGPRARRRRRGAADRQRPGGVA